MAKGWKSKFDEFMVMAGLVSPLATIPQIVKLYATHSEHASGQSLITWLVYTIIALLWVMYGAVKRELPILIGNGLGAIMYGIVTLGILLHAGVTF